MATNSLVEDNTCRRSNNVNNTDLDTEDNDIIHKYMEALKNTQDFVVLHQDKHFFFDQGDSTAPQSSSSLKITPAIVTPDDSTVIYGYFVEPESDGRKSETPPTGGGDDCQTALSKMSGFEFVSVNDFENVIAIPVTVKSEGMKHVSYQEDSSVANGTLDPDANKDLKTNVVNLKTTELNNLQVYADVGGVIKKDKFIKVIPCEKKRESLYIGSVVLKTNKINGTIKLYFDADLNDTQIGVLKDRIFRQFLLGLLT